MTKRFMKLSVLLVLIAIFIVSYTSKGENTSSSIFTSAIVGDINNIPFDFEVDMNPQQRIPFVGKSYFGFCEDLGFSESSGNYKAVNRLGYVGKYQFGASTLKWVGITNKIKFLESPLLQEEAFIALISKNKWVLRDYIGKYEGKVLNGVKITESGLIAAAHLGGAGNVKKFLESKGKDVFEDANQVPITRYMKKFSNYDLTHILPDNNARVTL